MFRLHTHRRRGILPRIADNSPNYPFEGRKGGWRFIAELQEIERLTVQLLSCKSLNPENPDSD